MEFVNLKVEDYPAFLKLYTKSFPDNERRDYRDAGHLADFIKMKGGKFRAFAAKDGDLFLAFLSYWVFEGYVYIEHFAVDPLLRGKRIGTEMLNHLFKEVSPDVLIEVELPGTPKTDRRIKFYERNGFRTREEINYVQPPYSPEKGSLPMLLMTHGNVNLHNMDSIKEMLEEVYNVKHNI